MIARAFKATDPIGKGVKKGNTLLAGTFELMLEPTLAPCGPWCFPPLAPHYFDGPFGNGVVCLKVAKFLLLILRRKTCITVTVAQHVTLAFPAFFRAKRLTNKQTNIYMVEWVTVLGFGCGQPVGSIL